MLQLERILNEIGALKRPRPDIRDALTDAITDVSALSVECDRLRDVLREACEIVDNAARESMLDQSPCYAFPMLREDEQVRLYTLLKGED